MALTESDLHPWLSAAGFRKKGPTWRRETDHGIEVVNLQRSHHNPGQTYLNIGLYRGDERDLRHPHEHECQTRDRVSPGEPLIEERVLAWFDNHRQRSMTYLNASRAADEFRVRHPSFGEGRCCGRRDDTLDIEFDDGSKRCVKAQYVEILS